MAKVWALWFGGSSYNSPDYCDAEEFPSLKAASTELWRREFGRDPYYPGVENSCMWLYLCDPAAYGLDSEPYPDFELTFGPRGGVVKRAC